jgi:hypothetical protein
LVVHCVELYKFATAIASTQADVMFLLAIAKSTTSKRS